MNFQATIELWFHQKLCDCEMSRKERAFIFIKINRKIYE